MRRSAPLLATARPPEENRHGVHDLEPLETVPVGEPVLVQVRGRDAPVVAIRDLDGDWQATWNGDRIMDPPSVGLHYRMSSRRRRSRA